MTTGSEINDVRRRGGWLPASQDALESWLQGHRHRVEDKGDQVALHPVITQFGDLIDSDPVLRMYFQRMIH